MNIQGLSVYGPVLGFLCSSLSLVLYFSQITTVPFIMYIQTSDASGKVWPGFSVIELLVVVCMIALLIAVLYPALNTARKTSRKALCMAHQRQWGVAVSLYAVNSDGYLPRRGQGVQPVMQIDRPEDWFNALPPMLKMKSFVNLVEAGQPPKAGDHSLWVCPAATNPGHKYFFAYAMNMMLSAWVKEKPDRIDDIGPPETMAFMADGPGTHCSVVPSFKQFSPVPRHKKSVNIVFLDGHVVSYGGEYVGCGVGDPHHNDIRWFVPGTDWPEPGQPPKTP